MSALPVYRVRPAGGIVRDSVRTSFLGISRPWYTRGIRARGASTAASRGCKRRALLRYRYGGTWWRLHIPDRETSQEDAANGRAPRAATLRAKGRVPSAIDPPSSGACWCCERSAPEPSSRTNEGRPTPQHLRIESQRVDLTDTEVHDFLAGRSFRTACEYLHAPIHGPACEAPSGESEPLVEGAAHEKREEPLDPSISSCGRFHRDRSFDAFSVWPETGGFLPSRYSVLQAFHGAERSP